MDLKAEIIIHDGTLGLSIDSTEVTVEKSDNGYVAHLSVDGNVVDNVYDFVELDTFSTYATVESRSE